MDKVAIVDKALAPPVGPFSQGVCAGDYIFLSGQIGQDARTGTIEGDIERQTEQALHNLREILAAGGKNFEDVVRVGVYLINMSDFAAMNSVYAKYFREPYPARTTIAVAGLPLGAAVEIDAIVSR